MLSGMDCARGASEGRLGRHPKKETNMSFEEPRFIEINMDAEIGSYQSDFGDAPVTELAAEGGCDEDAPREP
jgi:hypothetical protein